MRTDDLSLPDDMDLLKAMVRTMAEKTSALEDENAVLKARKVAVPLPVRPKLHEIKSR